MRRAFSILLLAILAIQCRASFTVTNEVDGTFDATSYDTQTNHLCGDYFATYFYCMYPQYTNHLYSWSHSGLALQGDYEQDEEKWCLPMWNSFAVPGNNWVLANDNGGYTSNQVYLWLTAIATGPGLFWNGTASTNEGYGGITITHYFPGSIPHDDPSTGFTAAKPLNDGSTNASVAAGTVVIDLLDWLWLGGWNTDITGSRLLGFRSGSHPLPAGHLAMAIGILVRMGVETNVGSCVIDFSAATLRSQSHMTITGLQLSGNTLTFSNTCDRMPMAWDVSSQPSISGVSDAFTAMPQLADAFRWMVQVTNLPSGNYQVKIDNSNVVILTSAQLAAGWNMFAVTNGPYWAHRSAVLDAKRDQEGADHVTLADHSAGSQGTLGVGDMVNYISNANDQYDSQHKRGSSFVSAMASFVSNVKQYDVAIHNAAVQTNHTFTITKINTLNVGTLNVYAMNGVEYSGPMKGAVGLALLMLNVIAPKPYSWRWDYVPQSDDWWKPVGFQVEESTNLTDWVLLGTTTNHQWAFAQDQPQDFYRFTTFYLP
jgi:hypothetical protein